MADIFPSKVIQLKTSSVNPIFHFFKCFLLVFGIILANFKKNYRAKILQTK